MRLTEYELKRIAHHLFLLMKEEKEQSNEDEWLTTKEAAKVLGYTEKTVRAKASMLPNNGKTGKERRYSKKGLTALITQ